MTDSTLLTPEEVAVRLRTSRPAIYRMIQRQQLPGVVRIGRRILVRSLDLEALIDGDGQTTEAT